MKKSKENYLAKVKKRALPESLYIKASESDHDKMIEKGIKKSIFNNDINV